MTQLEQNYRRLLGRLRHEYAYMAASGKTSRFQRTLRTTMQWADAVAAAQVRYKVTREHVDIPDKTRITIADAVKANPWLAQHQVMTKGLIRERVRFVSKIERRYWTVRRDLLPEDRERVAEYRLEMLYRNVLGDIVHTSQQVELSDPEIGGEIVFARYKAKCGKTGRKTHCVMHDFVAVTTWKGWSVVRPKNGYNCLCTLDLITRTEARTLGWLTKEDKPRFEVKWPNTASKRNYEYGSFPDPGWHGPKPVIA
jgi:hypothetical protein